MFSLLLHQNGLINTQVIKYCWQYLEFYIVLKIILVGLHVPAHTSNHPIRSRNFWVAISEINFHLLYWIFFFKFPFFISETCSYLMKGITAKRIAHTCLLTDTCKSNFYEYTASKKEIRWCIDSKNYDTSLDTEQVIRVFDKMIFKIGWLG